MTEFEYLNAGNTEAQDKLATAFLMSQVSTGKASTGVLTGLGVTQTGTASGSVQIAAGAGVVQSLVTDGASVLVNDTLKTLDIFTANPVGGLPRNDIVVFNALTPAIEAIIGTPNAVPTDPTVPATSLPLARLSHAASATTIPTAKITSLITKTSLFGAADESFKIRGVPMAGASTTKAGKRAHWGVATFNTTGSGTATVTHGAGFTPTAVIITSMDVTWRMIVDNITATTFRVTTYNGSGTAINLSGVDISYFCGE